MAIPRLNKGERYRMEHRRIEEDLEIRILVEQKNPQVKQHSWDFRRVGWRRCILVSTVFYIRKGN